MYGIKSRTATFATILALAIGVAAIATPAAAGGVPDHRGYGYTTAGYDKGYRHHHDRRYWHRHGHPGVTVHVWRPARAVPPSWRHRVATSCHAVVGKGHDHFGRRAKFGGTMCYDRYGRGYIAAGSRYVIRYY